MILFLGWVEIKSHRKKKADHTSLPFMQIVPSISTREKRHESEPIKTLGNYINIFFFAKCTCNVSSAAMSSNWSMSLVILEHTASKTVHILPLYVKGSNNGSHIMCTFSRIKATCRLHHNVREGIIGNVTCERRMTY